MNKNEKAAMLGELKVLMKEAHWLSLKPAIGNVNIRAVQARRTVNAVRQVLKAGLQYSMKRSEAQDLLEDLDREALDEVKREMEAEQIEKTIL